MPKDNGDEDYDYLFKIILLGDTCVGKTTIVSQFTSNNYNPYEEPTVGVDFKVKTIPINEKRVKLFLWDTAGQEKFHSIIQSYYKNIGGAVIVYDVTNPRSYNNVIFWIKEIRKKNEYDDGLEIPILIFGNKSDLVDNRKITTEIGQSMAQQYNVLFYEGNAKNNKNIDLMFTKLGEEMFTRFIYPNIRCHGIQENKKFVQLPRHAFNMETTNHALQNKIYHSVEIKEDRTKFKERKKEIDCNSCSIL